MAAHRDRKRRSDVLKQLDKLQHSLSSPSASATPTLSSTSTPSPKKKTARDRVMEARAAAAVSAPRSTAMHVGGAPGAEGSLRHPPLASAFPLPPTVSAQRRVQQPTDDGEKTLLDYVEPVYPAASPPPSSSPLVAIFGCYDGGAPELIYIQLEGNEAAIQRLRAIAAACEDEDFLVKMWPEPLTPGRVERLMAEGEDDERLRRALSAALPGGPGGDGWADKDMWTVGELQQRLLPGQVALLPLEAPEECEELGDYAVQVFSLNLQAFVR